LYIQSLLLEIIASILITSASYSLRLTLIKQLVAFPSSKVSKIIAAARGDALALKKIVSEFSSRVLVIKLDVTN
jgi:hypothetical protein